jgi:hypothetical protein
MEADSPRTSAPNPTTRDFVQPTARTGVLIALLVLLAVAIGALRAWQERDFINPDGISYLDMGDALVRGDWATAINAYWSPLYPALLGLTLAVFRPPPAWEFPLAHGLNFAIYLVQLAAFHFFWATLRRFAGGAAEPRAEQPRIGLPSWAWWTLGYALAVWSSAFLAGLGVLTPDVLVAACVYVAAGIVLRMRMGHDGWPAFVLLGVVLGVGYLAKAPMLLLGVAFVAVAWFAVWSRPGALPKVALGVLVFAVVAGPWVAVISAAKGRLTFGDSGRLNYVWYTSGRSHLFWLDDDAAFGAPQHPMKTVWDAPKALAFGEPLAVTYAPWYDPSHWHEGLRVVFDPTGQRRTLAETAAVYVAVFFGHLGALVAVFAVLYLTPPRWWLGLRGALRCWPAWVPAVAGLAMYSVVHVETRFIGAFVVLVWGAVLCGVRLPDSAQSRRLIAAAATVALLSLIVRMAPTTVRAVRDAARAAASGRAIPPGPDAQIAAGLRDIGVDAGAPIAVVGDASRAGWARLARLRIVAQVLPGSADAFWARSPAERARVIGALIGAGARAVVARPPAGVGASGWRRVAGSSLRAWLPAPGASQPATRAGVRS